MKMEKKQCTKCKHFLLFECFQNKKNYKINKVLRKVFGHLQKSRQQTKCKHGRQVSQCKDCGIFLSTTSKDQDAFFVAEVKFVSTTR